MEFTVLCFDRDMTVDVNFNKDLVNCPPDAEPVPLSWVKTYAHWIDGVDCWSTGNQHLRREAAIPGIKEARVLWETYNGRDAESVYDSEGYYSYKPARREGLRLIEDVYEAYSTDEDEIEFVVVDDVPLKDMEHEGWSHYFAWDFVRSGYRIENPVYTSTSVESEACLEDLEPNHDCLDRLIERYKMTTENATGDAE